MTAKRYCVMLTKPPRRAWQAYALHEERPVDLLAGKRLRLTGAAIGAINKRFGVWVSIRITDEPFAVMRARFLKGKV